MMYNGIQGYKDNAEQVINSVKAIAEEVAKSIPELNVVGNP